jgi:LacI family asc operon transcriptional repressor
MIKETIERLIFMLDGGEFNYHQPFLGELMLRDSLIPAPHANLVNCHRHFCR